ncbi:MAG: antirestriction protein ArdA [Pseudomonadota bacterium]
MTVLFAHPYDLSASGFYFETLDAYRAKAEALRNDHGDPVEEFEIQFIDGEALDAAVVGAMGIGQGDIGAALDRLGAWDDQQKLAVVIAVGECGYSVSWESCDPDGFDVEIYADQSLRDLAEAFVDEGLFGEVPEPLLSYLDYDAIARDLAMDYAEIEIAGTRYVYRCA